MTLWLFIGRLNPPHIWHLSIIDKALVENDRVIVLIWSKNLIDEQNLLSYEEIKELLLEKYSDNLKLQIIELRDDRSDLVWIYSIYRIIFENWNKIKDINLYGWDFKNDSAYNTIKKYENHFNNFKFNYIENSRSNSFINYNWKEYLISSTNLRKALNDWDINLASKFCEQKMFEKILKFYKK